MIIGKCSTFIAVLLSRLPTFFMILAFIADNNHFRTKFELKLNNLPLFRER